MNLLLLDETDLVSPLQAVIRGRRHVHLKQVNQIQVGQPLRVGMVNGLMGQARVEAHDEESTCLALSLTEAPPPPLPIQLLLALPRPRMLARSLEHMSTLGVKEIFLLHTARVEKSFWQSPELRPEKIDQHLRLGLEQARDTLLPKVHLVKRFKPFVEDELAALSAGRLKLVAHPGDYPPCPVQVNRPVTLVIGPEGGLVDYEVDLLQQQGFEAVQLGQRILRVETAVTALLSRLF